MGHWRVAVFKNGADLDREGLAAFLAFTQTNAGAFALKQGNAVLSAIAAVRANGAMRPEKRLDVIVGGLFIAKLRGV